ncbi:MFS transporter, partial [Rhodococcus sp. ACPA1]
ALVSADLSASLVPVVGTGLEVAAKGLYGIGYWLSGLLALLVVVSVLVSRARSGRRVGAAAS